MGEPFWQNNSLVSHILFELQPIIIFSPVTNFGNQSLFIKNAIENTTFKFKIGISGRTFQWKNCTCILKGKFAL